MATTIVTKSGSGAPAASDLVAGELAVDLTNGRLYTENSGGTVLELGLNPNGNVNVTGSVTADGLTVGDVTQASNAIIKTQVEGSDAGDFDSGLQMRSHNNDFGGTIALESRSGSTDVVAFKYHNNSASGVRAMAIDATNGDISFYEDTGTTPKFFWDASAESLGIGTNSPSSFNAAGTGIVTVSGTGTGASTLALYSGTTSSGFLYFSDGATGADRYQGYIEYSHTNNDMRIGTSGVERLRIDASGNLLAGKTATGIATVGAELKSTGELLATVNSDACAFLNRKTSDGDIAVFRKDGTTVGSISSRGGLTLGLILNPTSGSGAGLSGTSNAIFPIDETTTPVNDQISLGTTSNAFKDLYLSGGVYTGGDKFVYSYAGGAIGQVRSGLKLNGTNNQLEFYTGQAERMRIDSSGRLLVGKQTSVYSGMVEVQQTAGGTVSAAMTCSHASQPYGLLLNFTAASPDNNINYFITAADSTTNRFFVYSDGDVWTSDAGTLTSDERLKTNVQDATPKLDDLLALRVRNFEWIPEYHPNKVGEKKIGFIAQEFEQTFPALVTENTFELNGEEVTRKSLRMGALIPILVKGMQEQQATIEALTARIAALES